MGGSPYLCIFLTLFMATAATGTQIFTPEEQKALDKFRPLVDPILYKDFMKTDDFLIRWLRAKELNIDQAKTFLEKNIAWRKTERMDDALQEDQSKGAKCTKVTRFGHDRNGRPSVYVYAGQWDVRKCALAGHMPEMIRYTITTIFEATEQAVASTANVTQGYIICDLHGFNPRQGGCLRCLPLYVAQGIATENHYPGLFHKYFLINSPRAFNPVVSIFRPILSKQHNDLVHIIGHGKDEWGPILAKDFAPDQLLAPYGGQKRI